ncbi:hypothetical protein MMC21_005050 [Puttea exsequens]|nr:hypothetical protein [Puttea exsequens]
MNGRQAPRVKLPAAIPRKPVMSGPPEPARYFQEQHGTKYDHTGTSQVTKKDKYEHKPMPPTPTNDGSPPRSYLQPKRYIQPAIPLVSPVSSSHHPKKRAVTDPVVPKPLFAKKQPSVSQLRRKFSNLKENEGASDEEAVEGVIVDNPAPRLSSEKAARILGLYPVYNSRSTTPAVSAPNSVILNPVHDTHDTEGAATPSRQVQSTPVPTRRYLQENGLPTPTLVEPLGTPERPGVEAAAISLGREREEINVTSDNGMLHPHKVGTFGNVSDIGLVQESGMHRIESFRGVIETASPERVSHNDSNATPNSGHVRFDTEGRRHDEAGLTPSVNTPSAYAGVWENDPAVVSVIQQQFYLG